MIWLVICLKSTSISYAQWTKQDSLWLQHVLTGKDTIRLNPETMRAIQGGTFLNMEKPSTPLLLQQSKIPILKDFSAYIHLEDSSRVAITDMPSWIFWLRQLKEPPPNRGHQINPLFFIYYSGDWLSTVPMDNMGRIQSRGQGTADFAHGLNVLFSPEYRQHYKNKLRAEVSLKAYNEAPSKEMLQRMKKIKEQQRELPLPLVTQPKATEQDSTRKKTIKKEELRPDSILHDSTQVPPPATSQSSLAPDSLSGATPADSPGYKKPLN